MLRKTLLATLAFASVQAVELANAIDDLSGIEGMLA